MFLSFWQDVGHVLHAVVVERAYAIKTDAMSWIDVAKKMRAEADATWPRTLGDPSDYNVSLDVDPLSKRLKKFFRKGVDRKQAVALARAKAIGMLNLTQAHRCPDDMSLWNYCISKMNSVVHKGKLAALETSVKRTRNQHRQKQSSGKKVAKPTEPSPPPVARKLALPGTVRGGKGGGGCGGAIPIAVKNAARDLVI